MKEKAFWVAIAALVGLEIVSIFAFRLDWGRDLTPLAWTAMVRGADIIAFFVVFRVFRASVSRAGLKKPVKGILIGLGVSLVLGSGFFLFLHAVRYLMAVDLSGFVSSGNAFPGFAALTILCLIGPFAEEVFFRGLCYGLMRDHWGVWLSVPLSACLFAAIHAVVAGAVGVALVPLAGGIAMALVYEFTGSLFAPFILHAAANLVLFSGII
jgi:membrane protease YdiL (CAAX protease family)